MLITLLDLLVDGLLSESLGLLLLLDLDLLQLFEVVGSFALRLLGEHDPGVVFELAPQLVLIWVHLAQKPLVLLEFFQLACLTKKLAQVGRAAPRGRVALLERVRRERLKPCGGASYSSIRSPVDRSLIITSLR